jgi:hypothetical protein
MRKFVLMVALSVLPTTAAHAGPPVTVPEPSNYVLIASGLAALAVVARRRRRA